VPSTSSKRRNGEPCSRAAIAGPSGNAGIAGDSDAGKRGLVLDSHDLGGSRENRVEPVEDRGVVQLSPHAAHSPAALVRRHFERRTNAGDKAVDIERIDQDSALDLLRRPSEAAEDQYPALVDLAGDELLGHEIHSVLERRHDAEITGAIDGGQQIGIHVLVDQHDRRPVRRPKAAVDRDDRLKNISLERVVRREVRSRRRADEDEREPLAQLGRLRPERFQRANALRDSFRVVDAIDAHAELAAPFHVPLAQRVDADLALRRRRHLLEPIDVDADRKRPDVHDAVAKGHSLVDVIHARLGHELLHAVEEVRRVAIDLELEQIVAEQASQHRLVNPRRKKSQDVGGWKGDVPKLVDEERRAHRSQKLRREGEMIVLDPGHRAARASLGFVGDGVGETQIDRSVALPELGAILEVLDQHVTQRPERAVGESVVVTIDVRLVEPDAAQRVAGFARRHGDASGFVGHLAVGVAGTPGHPRPVGAAHRRIERRYQAARRLLDLHAVHAANVLVRFAVGDEDEFAVVQVMCEIGHGPGMGSNRHARYRLSIDAIGEDSREDYVTLLERNHNHARADAHRFRRRMDRRAALLRRDGRFRLQRRDQPLRDRHRHPSGDADGHASRRHLGRSRS
jgi:hypothetical protein